MKSFLLCFFFLIGAREAFSSASLEFKIESLLRGQQISEAFSILDLKEKELDKSTYHRLKGRALFLEKKYDEAQKEFHIFLKLSKKNQKNTAVVFTMAQIDLKLKKPMGALAHLNKIKDKSIQKDLLWSQALWDQGQRPQAVTYLEKTEKNKYESYDLIKRQTYYYLFNLGLLSRIFKSSKKYLSEKNSSSEVGLYVVSLLKKKDAYLAESYFDLLLSLKPKDGLLLKERGLFELENKKPFVASLFLDRAAHLNKDYSFEAAAVHLDLGQHSRSLFFNSKVLDTKKQLLQKFTILLDSERFEQALSLKYDLLKKGLLEEDKVNYALMYAAYKVRDYKTFSEQLSKIASKTYLSKVLKLKEIVDSCKKSMGPQCVFS
jgi:tetratricopeptide (TPR) repeat protein